MLRRLITAAVGLFALVGLAAAASPALAAPAVPWDDPAAWRGLDWNHVEDTAWWRAMPRGQDFNNPDKQIFGDTPRVAGPVGSAGATLGGQPMKVILYGPVHPGGVRLVRVESDFDAPLARCKQSADAVARVYGPADATLDSSQKLAEGLTLYAMNWQWRVGATSVTVSCLGVFADDKPDKTALQMIDFEPLADAREIKPMLYLHCQVGENSKGVDLLVDESFTNVMNAGRSSLDDKAVITETQISFKLSKDARMVIDRTSGAFEATGLADHVITGLCKKADPPGRAF